jgi:hypothetical protein
MSCAQNFMAPCDAPSKSLVLLLPPPGCKRDLVAQMHNGHQASTPGGRLLLVSRLAALDTTPDDTSDRCCVDRRKSFGSKLGKKDLNPQ